MLQDVVILLFGEHLLEDLYRLLGALYEPNDVGIQHTTNKKLKQRKTAV